jgi:HSP20 family protein
MPCDPLRDLRAWQERLERLAAPHGVSALDAWTPPVDVYETDDRYVVTVEVPGLTRDEIALAVEDNRLSIRGTRAFCAPESATRHYHQVERGHGSFQRTFAFVEMVQADGIAADLREGVLTVTLHKAKPHGRRTIEVR